MLNAVEKIVDTYVQLDDHQALEELRTYRQGLAVHLRACAGLDLNLLSCQIDAEIAMIEAGLDKLASSVLPNLSRSDAGASTSVGDNAKFHAQSRFPFGAARKI